MDAKLFDLSQMGAGLVALSLVVWVVRRVFTHTIPRLADDFKASMTASQSYFREEILSSREAFRVELAAQRSDFRDTLREEREALGRRLDRLSAAVEELLRRQEL